MGEDDQDPRTAEVLRALERARGRLVEPRDFTAARLSERAAALLLHEVHQLRGALSKATLLPDEIAERLAANTRVLDRSLSGPSAALVALQRRYEILATELGESARRQRQEADRIAAWHAWWKRQVAAWALVLGIIFVAGGALLWRAHGLAQNTHDILQQILENQTKAQAARTSQTGTPSKGTRR